MSKESKQSYLIKQAFHNALIELEEKKPLGEITATEVIQKAQLSRSTFYRHFNDIYDLAVWKYKSILDEITTTEHKSYSSLDEFNQESLTFYQYVYDHRQYFRRMLEYTGQNNFKQYYLQQTIAWAGKVASTAERSLNRTDYYVIKYHVAGTMELMNEWVASDDPMTPAEMNEIIILSKGNRYISLFFADEKTGNAEDS